MAPAASKATQKRKAPAFNPPRPKSSKPTKTAAAPRRKSAPASRPSLTHSEEEEEEGGGEEEDSDGNSDDDEMDEPSRVSPPSSGNDASEAPEPSSTQEPPPTLPPALLTKLLHHHFQDEKTRIGTEASGVVGKYIETFVREAIARAAYERQAGEKGTRGVVGDDFLEVEDLEKLAPQLLLDF